MQRLDLNSVLSKMQVRTPSVVATITDYQMVTESLARVIVAFNTLEGSSREELSQAIAKAMDNDGSVVEGSFRLIKSMGMPAMHGFVKANTVSKPYDEQVVASATNMQALASNMFIDRDDDSLWTVKSGSNGAKMLTRQANDDLSKIMATARTHLHNQPRLMEISSFMQDVGNREFVAFVDPSCNELRHGYVLAAEGDMVQIVPTDRAMDKNMGDNQRDGNSVAERMEKEDEPVSVQTAMIVESAYLAEADAERFENAEIAAPVDSKSNAAMKAYYKELYAYDPAYYAMIEKQINEHASL